MKPGKLQRDMLLLWFLRGHVVLTLHSQNTAAVVEGRKASHMQTSCADGRSSQEMER